MKLFIDNVERPAPFVLYYNQTIKRYIWPAHRRWNFFLKRGKNNVSDFLCLFFK